MLFVTVKAWERPDCLAAEVMRTLQPTPSVQCLQGWYNMADTFAVVHGHMNHKRTPKTLCIDKLL